MTEFLKKIIPLLGTGRDNASIAEEVGCTSSYVRYVRVVRSKLNPRPYVYEDSDIPLDYSKSLLENVRGTGVALMTIYNFCRRTGKRAPGWAVGRPHGTRRVADRNIEIERLSHTMSGAELARRYGLSIASIYAICFRVRHSHD